MAENPVTFSSSTKLAVAVVNCSVVVDVLNVDGVRNAEAAVDASDVLDTADVVNVMDVADVTDVADVADVVDVVNVGLLNTGPGRFMKQKKDMRKWMQNRTNCR